MTDSASKPAVDQVDQALAVAHREERDELKQARIRDQELADRVAQTLSDQRKGNAEA